MASRDSSLVEELGGAASILRGASLQIHRVGSTASTTAELDSSGRFVLPDQLEGSYEVSATRVLSDAERARLSPTNSDVDAFTASAVVALSAPSVRLDLTSTSGRRGNLVLSEVLSYSDRDATTGNYYNNAYYVELYNNSDSTIYLDGLTFAQAFGTSFDYPNFPCSIYEPLTLDPTGLWARWLWRFPGSGRTYPLAPGNVVLVATDAIDHRPFARNAPDLSQANFEFRGGSDVDNPAVPDMIQFGTDRYSLFGGFIPTDLALVLVVARPLVLEQLEKQPLPPSGLGTLQKIPADQIIDVLTHRKQFNATYPWCRAVINERFDRSPVGLIGEDAEGRTLQRRVLYTRNGRPVLLRSGSSGNDFIVAPRSPGTVP